MINNKLNQNFNRRRIIIGMICSILISFPYCNPRKKYKKTFYPGTEIVKSEGYYLDKLPVDTIKNYSRIGWLTSVDVYNANGKLNGIQKVFFENGVCSQIVNYENGVLNGKTIAYNDNGTIKLIGFFYSGRPMGDVYFYDTVGVFRLYNFRDFNNKTLTVKRYDDNGITSGMREGDFYLYDSITVANGKNGTDTIKTLLLISHQPKISMRIRIDNVAKNGQVIFSKVIDPDKQIVFYDNVISNEVDSIKEIGVRYDSVLKESKIFMIVRLTKDLR